jgi:hypothetical protein
VQGVRDAGEDAVAQLPGFTRAGARKLLDALADLSPTAPPRAPTPAPSEPTSA